MAEWLERVLNERVSSGGITILAGSSYIGLVGILQQVDFPRNPLIDSRSWIDPENELAKDERSLCP